MRHLGAGLAIPDFPLSLGRLVPPLDELPVAVHFAHRVGAVLVGAAVAHAAWRARQAHEPRLFRHAVFLLALVGAQVGLGAVTVLGARAPLPTTAHVALGAAVLAGCWLLTLRARRRLSPRAAARLSPAVAA
jgi:heme A synthase